MQIRRPEKMNPDEVMVEFENNEQAKVNKIVLKENNIKFRVSSKLRIFLPNRKAEEKVKGMYGIFPVPVISDDILIEKDDYYIDDDSTMQMINKETD